MPVSFIANSAAQFAQSAIRVRNDALAAGSNRLSSGLRVTSAGDDAAASAVGSGLKIINRTLAAASLNASSAISTLQIADGSLNEIGNLMIRLQSLATQSSSGQNDTTARSLINDEFQKLLTEINRIGATSEFNGVTLLAGARQFLTTNANNLGALGVSNVRIDPDLITADRTYRISYDNTTESLTVARLDAGTTTSQTFDITALLDDVAGAGQNIAAGSALEVGFSALGIILTLDNQFDRATSFGPSVTVTPGPDLTLAATGFTNATTNVPQDVSAALQALAGGYNTTSGNLTLPITTDGTAIRLGALAGISYRVNGGAVSASGVQSDTLLLAGPNTVEVFVDLQAPATGTTALGNFTTGAVATTGTTSGSLVVGVGVGLVGADYVNNNAPTRLTYKIGLGVASGQDLLNVDIPAFSIDALGLTGLNVTTELNANTSVDQLKIALNTLNLGRATVGAQQLRLEQILSNLSVVTINNEAARSTLLDADISEEIAAYTTNQALLEAGVAILARANQLPNVLLQLLRSN
jgi:flagellin